MDRSFRIACRHVKDWRLFGFQSKAVLLLPVSAGHKCQSAPPTTEARAKLFQIILEANEEGPRLSSCTLSTEIAESQRGLKCLVRSLPNCPGTPGTRERRERVPVSEDS